MFKYNILEKTMHKLLYLVLILLFSGMVYAAPPSPLDLHSNTPKRIIVLEFSLLDDLHQLGIKPVGIGTSGSLSEGSDPEYLRSIIVSTPSVGARDAPNLEAISNLRPDLIIGDIDFNINIKSQLEKIAPTLLLKGIFGSPEQQMDNLKIIANMTHTTSHVSGIIAAYNSKYKQAQHSAKKTGNTKILIGFPTTNNSFNALANNSITSHVLANLGKHNMITQNTSSQLFELSVEGLLAKNPDQIVILLTNNDRRAYNMLQKNPLWQQLMAVKNNKIYFVDRNIWAKSHGIEALELMYQQGIESGFLENTPAKHE